MLKKNIVLQHITMEYCFFVVIASELNAGIEQ